MANQEDLVIKQSFQPQDWQARVGSAAIVSGLFGCGVGAIEAFWTDVPLVKKESTLPAVRATANVVKNNGLFFAFVGATYAVGEQVAWYARGKQDVWNGVYGGLAAGAVVGVKAVDPIKGAAAGLLFGAVSAAVDMSGQQLSSSKFTDSHKTFNYGHGVQK
eukprot:TRINITY_DN1358_c0_g1_i1.p1 TRINITY_DN1358_c0_g1~~TRINITY_DN1358_c0_g1_i1.p1  ORF type:complete len:161 (+),score=44.31 TRINITY_DN1358_c0_g1_i1:222-704(+)